MSEYSDDRKSICLEIRNGLTKRGYWAPKDDGPDMITAVFRAIQAERTRVIELELREKRMVEALDRIANANMAVSTSPSIEAMFRSLARNALSPAPTTSLATALMELVEAGKPLDEEWFDPSGRDGACKVCDCNLHENVLGIHGQLNGDPCPLQVFHDAHAKVRKLMGERDG